MRFYVPQPTPPTELQQGDLLDHVPFAYFEITRAQAVGGPNQVAVERDLTQGPRDPVIVNTRVEFGWGAVLNQTCDLQRDRKTGTFPDPVLIARVLPVLELYPAADFSSAAQALKTIRSFTPDARAPNTFYLPQHGDESLAFPRSAVNLLDVHPYSPRDVEALLPLSRMRLSPEALHAFQSRCAYCFGRFAVPDELNLSSEERAEMERQKGAANRR